MRYDYTLLLEITPTAPLTHGMGSEGNQQLLLTREVLAQTEAGWEELEVPAVSGAALKATLREHAVTDYYERAGVAEGTVSRDHLRLLLKGGKNDAGGQSVSLEEARRLRDLCPVLSVFGSMDQGLPLRSKVTVSDVLPWTRETVAAGLVPAEVRPLTVSLDGEEVHGGGAGIPVYGGRTPPDLHQVRSEVTYYRHDLLNGALAPMMEAQERAAIEDARAARKGKTVPKADRREANESMPHSAQCIRAGAPLVAVLRLHGADTLDFACLGIAIARWIRTGAFLGGGATKGHGACTVRVAGALRHDPTGPVVAEGPLVDLSDHSEPARVYDAHVRERAAAIRAWASESTR